MTNKLKVIHVITGLEDGGAEAVLFRLVTYPYKDIDVTHHVVSMMGPGKYGPLLEAQGIAVTCLNMPSGRVTAAGLKTLFGIFRQNRDAVVQTWMYHANLFAGVLAKAAGINKIYWGIHHTDLDPKRFKRSTVWIARYSSFLTGFVPAKIICCAKKSVEVHRDVGYVPEKLVAVFNGYDLNSFAMSDVAREQVRSELNVGDRLLLGMVGRFHPQKDHANLFKALGLLKKQTNLDFLCAVVGTDLDEKNQLVKSWIQENGIEENVLLLGRRSDIPAVMNALDIHLLSSSTGEAFPNVLSEAMACGAPCISTDVGDAPHIIGETGWIVPPSNPQALADAIVKAVDARKDPASWQARRLEARKRILDNFNLDLMASRYLQHWLA